MSGGPRLRQLGAVLAAALTVAAVGAPGGLPEPRDGQPVAVEGSTPRDGLGPPGGKGPDPAAGMLAAWPRPATTGLDADAHADGGTDADVGTEAAEGVDVADRAEGAAAPRQVRIAALNVTADVLEMGLDEDGRLQVPEDGGHVGWWGGGSAPAEAGPAVLVGHVDWGGQPAVFHGLTNLAAGDVVEVEDAEGVVSRFAVRRTEQHPKDDLPTAAVYGDTDEPTLRLITCAGPFDAQVGHYTDNLIVFAEPLEDSARHL